MVACVQVCSYFVLAWVRPERPVGRREAIAIGGDCGGAYRTPAQVHREIHVDTGYGPPKAVFDSDHEGSRQEDARGAFLPGATYVPETSLVALLVERVLQVADAECTRVGDRHIAGGDVCQGREFEPAVGHRGLKLSSADAPGDQSELAVMVFDALRRGVGEQLHIAGGGTRREHPVVAGPESGASELHLDVAFERLGGRVESNFIACLVPPAQARVPSARVGGHVLAQRDQALKLLSTRPPRRSK